MISRFLRNSLLAIAALLLVPLAATAEERSNPQVVIQTSLGDISLELYADKAPATVANFIAYVEKDGYRQSIFHRVIEGFMIQGGGHYADMSLLEELAPVTNEADNGLSNLTGTIAMARDDDIDSATRQFFINVADNRRLDHSAESCTREDEAKIKAAAERGLYRPQSCQSFGYTVFGQVTGGMPIVMQIEKLETRVVKAHDDVPQEPVFIEAIRIE